MFSRKSKWKKNSQIFTLCVSFRLASKNFSWTSSSITFLDKTRVFYSYRNAFFILVCNPRKFLLIQFFPILIYLAISFFPHFLSTHSMEISWFYSLSENSVKLFFCNWFDIFKWLLLWKYAFSTPCWQSQNVFSRFILKNCKQTAKKCTQILWNWNKLSPLKCILA